MMQPHHGGAGADAETRPRGERMAPASCSTSRRNAQDRPVKAPPYRLVARAANPAYAGNSLTRIVHVGPVRVGGARPVIVAGPCAVESREQTLAIARAVKAAG